MSVEHGECVCRAVLAHGVAVVHRVDADREADHQSSEICGRWAPNQQRHASGDGGDGDDRPDSEGVVEQDDTAERRQDGARAPGDGIRHGEVAAVVRPREARGVRDMDQARDRRRTPRGRWQITCDGQHHDRECRGHSELAPQGEEAIVAPFGEEVPSTGSPPRRARGRWRRSWAECRFSTGCRDHRSRRTSRASDVVRSACCWNWVSIGSTRRGG